MEDAAVRKRLAQGGETQKPVCLKWNGNTNETYSLDVRRVGGESQCFAVSNRTDVQLTNLEIGAKYEWSVTDRAGSVATGSFVTEDIPPRLLYAGGVKNLRDIGGWKGHEGQRVRQGMVYRSAGLRLSARQKGGSLFGGRIEAGERRVTPAGIVTLRDDLKIKTDLELRTRREAACMESSVLGDDVKWLNIPFVAYDFIDNPVRGREPFAKIFKTFLDERNYPILFHCSGGRDRTGTLSFLLNGLLGVSEDDLCRDWEATVFSEGDLSFGPDRLGRLLEYLKGFGCETVGERCEHYVLGCGITREEIETFRRIMLESND